VTAMRTLAAVHPLMLVMCMNDRLCLFGGSEMPDGGFLVIDPNDGVIMRH
jgi:hypothetical protein